jgi:hypothetical protein
VVFKLFFVPGALAPDSLDRRASGVPPGQPKFKSIRLAIQVAAASAHVQSPAQTVTTSATPLEKERPVQPLVATPEVITKISFSLTGNPNNRASTGRSSSDPGSKKKSVN